MATARKSTKSTAAEVVEETVEAVSAEPSTKQLINSGIDRVVEATGVDSQKARYKAMRAIAFVAFRSAIEDGTFDDLVEAAISDADELPTGWQLERSVAAEKPVAKAKASPAKAASKAAPTKGAAAKPAARKRPTR
jgi:hypothetical protein